MRPAPGVAMLPPEVDAMERKRTGAQPPRAATEREQPRRGGPESPRRGGEVTREASDPREEEGYAQPESSAQKHPDPGE